MSLNSEHLQAEDEVPTQLTGVDGQAQSCQLGTRRLPASASPRSLLKNYHHLRPTDSKAVEAESRKQ